MPGSFTKSILLLDDLLSHLFLSQCYLCQEISLTKRVCESCLILEKLCVDVEGCSRSFAMLDQPSTSTHSVFWINDNILKLFRLIKYCHEHALMNVFEEAIKNEPIKLSNIEMICAVPMSKKSWHERGFNTAEEVAKWISKKLNVPVENGLLKVRDTANQASLNKKERQKNLKDAYKWNPKIKIPNSVLIVDDICTTGATFEECRKTALEAGIERVSTFSLFQTPLYLSHSLNRL